MKAAVIEMSLTDLQKALASYVKAKGYEEVGKVIVMSYDKAVLTVELRPCGLVEAVEFKHRS